MKNTSYILASLVLLTLTGCGSNASPETSDINISDGNNAVEVNTDASGGTSVKIFKGSNGTTQIETTNEKGITSGSDDLDMDIDIEIDMNDNDDMTDIEISGNNVTMPGVEVSDDAVIVPGVEVYQ